MFWAVWAVLAFEYKLVKNGSPNKWRSVESSCNDGDWCFWQDLYVSPRPSSRVIRYCTLPELCQSAAFCRVRKVLPAGKQNGLLTKKKNRCYGSYLLHMRNSYWLLFGVPGVRAFQKIAFHLFSLGKVGSFERLPQDSLAKRQIDVCSDCILAK